MKTSLPPKGQEVSLDEIEVICAEYHLHELWAKIKNDMPEKPFKSDGCSGGWPDTWHDFNLYPACFIHDIKYWCGHEEDEDVDRMIADLELRIDILRITQSIALADIMFAGVRAGGGSGWGRSYSWGFGRDGRDRG